MEPGALTSTMVEYLVFKDVGVLMTGPVVEFSTYFVIIVTTEVTGYHEGYRGTYKNHVNTVGLVRQLRVKDAGSGVTRYLWTE